MIVMRSVGHVLVCVVLMCWIHSANAQAEKRPYKILVEEIGKHIPEDPSYIVVHLARPTLYNRTQSVVNVSLSILQDLPADAQVDATMYEKLKSQRYSMIPLTLLHGNLCKLLEVDTIFWPTVIERSNFGDKCPVLKGDYWLRRFTVDESLTPMQLPGVRWRLDFTIIVKNKTVFKMSFFIYFKRDIKRAG